MLVSVGSGSNADDPDTHPREFHQADVLDYTPDGKFVEVYALASATDKGSRSVWCVTHTGK
jgi:hypothetical protein